MMQQQQRKRRGGGTRTTLIGATSFKEELRQAGESEQPMLAKYDVSQGNLDAVKSEPWAQKRLAKLRQTLGKGFDVTFQKNARRGETSRQGIEIGHEGLTSKEMARVTLRHELDHAKFYDPNRKLRIGPYRASYVGRGKVGPEKDTFHYRLEEMLVRLRDFEHASTGNKTAFTEGFSEDDARKRISTAYSDLLNAKDIEEIDPTYRKEVLAKLWHMQYALCNPV